jgi:hypothetical protein
MAGVYTVTVTNASGCTATTTANVVVNTLPTPSAIGGSFCEGSTINLTTGITTTYLWNGPNSFSSTIQNPSIANSTTAMGGVYTLTVTNGSGCSATTTTTITVNPRPVLTPVGGTFCEGSTINLSLTVSGGSGFTFIWNGPASFTANTQNTSRINATTAMGGIYTITVTNATSCTTSATTTVIINVRPIVSATGGTFCEAATITLSTTVSAGSSFTYSWTGPSSFTSNIKDPTRASATTAMGGIYTIVVNNNFNCTTSATTSVIINALPASPTLAPASICGSGSVNLSATGCGGTVNWYNSRTGTTTINVGTNFATPTLTESRYYFAECSSNNCVSPTRPSVLVTINSNPNADATAVNSTCLSNVAANNGKIILSKFSDADQYSQNTGSTYNSITATSWATIPTNGEILTGISNPASSISYTIRVRNTAGCTVDRTVTLTVSCSGCPIGYCEKPTITKLR